MPLSAESRKKSVRPSPEPRAQSFGPAVAGNSDAQIVQFFTTVQTVFLPFNVCHAWMSGNGSAASVNSPSAAL